MRGIHIQRMSQVQVLPCLLIQWSLSTGDNGLRQVKAAACSQFQKYIIYNSKVINGSHGVERSEKEFVPFWLVFSSEYPRISRRNI